VNNVIAVVRSFAIEGFAIIVGRAGHIIANDIENAIHVRLTAPIDYRIKTIQVNNDLNYEEALRFIKKVEKERIAFRKAIREESLHEELFDMTLNRATFTDNDIVELINAAILKKDILHNVRPRIQYY